MNILQLVPNLEIGGVETGTVDLARHLALNGHKACVISGGGKLVRKLDEAGARHYSLPIGSKSLFVIPVMIFRVAEIIKKENIDIVHARSRIPALIGFFASRLTSRTFITTAHGQYKKHILSYVMGWGKLVIVANSVMGRYMMDNFNTRSDKLRIVPRGVNMNKFAFQLPDDRIHDRFTVGMLSRMTPLKGHPDFIRAVSIASRSIPRLKAYIVGGKKTAKADYMNEIEILIKRLALNNIVELIDETEDVPSVLSKFDVLVSASREQEAFGRVIIEAQAVGVPCVATKVGGTVGLIENGKTGLLCEPQDPRDMADKILALYRDERLRNHLAENARKSVEKNYSLESMVEPTIRVYKEARELLRILVIKISALGDVILSIPSLRAIRAKYPKAVIKVLVGIESREALVNIPFIDGVIVSDFKNRDKGSHIFRIGAMLRKEDFDIVIDFQNNKKSHLLAFLSFAPLRYGYANGKWSFFLNRAVKDSKPSVNPIEHQARVLKLMGLMDFNKDLYFPPAESDREWADDFLKSNWIRPGAPLVCFNLESSPKWETKRWPAENFVRLAERLAETFRIRVIVTGKDPNDRGNAEFFRDTLCKPVNAVGRTTLRRLAAIIERTSLLVTSDSAPMHIAAAVGTPFLALFGPTDPARHLPPAKSSRVIRKNIDCSPCYKASCGRNFACMRTITPDEVFEEISKMLKPEARKEEPIPNLYNP